MRTFAEFVKDCEQKSLAEAFDGQGVASGRLIDGVLVVTVEYNPPGISWDEWEAANPRRILRRRPAPPPIPRPKYQRFEYELPEPVVNPPIPSWVGAQRGFETEVWMGIDSSPVFRWEIEEEIRRLREFLEATEA